MMCNRFFAILLLLCTSYSLRAQFSKNFAAYVVYAIINEPNITFEYRLKENLALSLEGAGFIPFKKEQNLSGIFLTPTTRLNCTGGSIRTGISIYGTRRFGIMHRFMADITYVKSGLYREIQAHKRLLVIGIIENICNMECFMNSLSACLPNKNVIIYS